MLFGFSGFLLDWFVWICCVIGWLFILGFVFFVCGRYLFWCLFFWLVVFRDLDIVCSGWFVCVGWWSIYLDVCWYRLVVNGCLDNILVYCWCCWYFLLLFIYCIWIVWGCRRSECCCCELVVVFWLGNLMFEMVLCGVCIIGWVGWGWLGLM